MMFTNLDQRWVHRLIRRYLEENQEFDRVFEQLMFTAYDEELKGMALGYRMVLR